MQFEKARQRRLFDDAHVQRVHDDHGQKCYHSHDSEEHDAPVSTLSGFKGWLQIYERASRFRATDRYKGLCLSDLTVVLLRLS